MTTDKKNEILARKLAVITSSDHVLGVINELAGMWHRANGMDSDHSAGRATGFCVAISRLLDAPYAQVHGMLRSGLLTGSQDVSEDEDEDGT